MPATAARGEERARTLAIADFAVRAEAARTPQYAWLGAAVPELLQAKLQLFSGTRVLERLRLDPGIFDHFPTTAGNAPRIVAEVLLLGSVEIAPGVGASTSIKVQARAVETETGRIISEATFTGSTELAGLLRIAEELARTLADGLSLSYTPAQLAYAEPAGIEALQFYLEGNVLLAGARTREAVQAYQRALDGNGGKFYGAAHRAQGEAYQELSRSLSGAAAREASEEYLRKFKADALTASGALFDLGVALEANGLWREAIGAYEDYLKVVGTEGEMVKWTFSPAKDLAMPRAWVLHPAVVAAGRIHLLVINGQPITDARWVVLDSRTGAVIKRIPLLELFGLNAGDLWDMQIVGADSGAVYFCWYGVLGEVGKPSPDDRHCGNPWVAAVDASSRVLWRTLIGTDRQYVGDDARAFQGRLVLTISGGETVVLLASDGSIRDRYSGEDGIYDLASDRFFPKSSSARPTGVAGVTAEIVGSGNDYRLLRDGQPLLEIKDCRPLARPLYPTPRGWIMCDDYFRSKVGAINPEDRSSLDLYRELKAPLIPLGQDEDYLVFALQNYPGSELDPRFGMASTVAGTAINVVSKSTRTVAGKTFLKRYEWIALDGHDLIVNTEGAVSRHDLVPQAGMAVVPSGDAHLRIARCLLALDDIPRADEHLARFEAQSPGDPRAALLRMKQASNRGDTLAAGRLSFAALTSGGVSEADAQSCLAAIRAVRPEVRDLVITPVKSQLLVRAMVKPGVLVYTPNSARRDRLLLVVDTAAKRTSLVPLPEFSRAHYRGKFMYYFWHRRLVRMDLLSGKLTAGEKFRPDTIEKSLNYNGWFVPGMPFWVSFSQDIKLPKWKTENLLIRFDPEDLHQIDEVNLGNLNMEPAFIGNPMVFANTKIGLYDCDNRVTSFLVLEPDTGKEIARIPVSLDQERVFAITADRDRLIVGINGGDFRQYLTGREGIWFRIESFPLGPGGQRWSYRHEGRIAGNIIFDGPGIVFPAYEGRLPAPKVEIMEERWRDHCENREKFVKERVSFEGPELAASRITLDLHDGSKLLTEPLQANPWDKRRESNVKTFLGSPDLCYFCAIALPIHPSGSQVIFPGLALSREGYIASPDVYWPATPDRVPLIISPEPHGEDYRIVNADYLSWKDTVYEQIGGGVILVKDFAGGNGLERIAGILGGR